MSILKRIQNGEVRTSGETPSTPVQPVKSPVQPPSLQARRISAPPSSIGQDTYQDLKTRVQNKLIAGKVFRISIDGKFDGKARALDGVLHKGTAVEVIAYEHHKTKSDPATGRRRDVREYYATTVTPKLRAGESASEAPGDPRS